MKKSVKIAIISCITIVVIISTLAVTVHLRLSTIEGKEVANESASHKISEIVNSISNTTNSSNVDCENRIQNQKNTITSAINETKALSLAENSDLFNSTLHGKRIASYYTYYRWTEDTNSCSVILKSVNVDFTIFSGNCGGANYVFKEDANLTKVTDVIFAGSWSSPYCPSAHP